MYQQKTLDNGLKIVTQELPGTQAVTVLVLVGAGSRNETKKINGISHFLEHMFFKGAKKYENTEEISSLIDSVGGDFNAFTGKEYAGYYVKLAHHHQDLAFDLLSDMMLDSRFDSADIEKERGVILEEYNMYQDTPIYQIGWNFENLIYGDQPMGWDQVGTKELITTVKKEDFLKYKKDLYTPDNCVIVVVGAIKHKEAQAKAEQYFAFGDDEKAYDWKGLNGESNLKKVHLTHKKTEQTHVVVGVPAYPTSHPDQYALKMLSIILGGNMSSRMFLSIREKQGLCYYIQTSIDDYTDSGIISTRAGVDIKRSEQAISAIVAEYKKVAEGGVTEEELKKAKEYYKGKMILKLEDSEEYGHLLGRQALLEDKINTPEDIQKMIDAVTVQDIARISKELFTEDKLKLAVIGPFKEEEDLNKLLTFK